MKYIFSFIFVLLGFGLFGQSTVNNRVIDTLSNYQSATCLIIYDGAYTCTGTLLNNTAIDGRPLILSAAHCIDDPSQIESVIIILGRQRILLSSNISGVEWRSNFGAKLVAFDKQLDFAILELEQEIPDELMCQFMGWDASSQVVPVSSTIHHPSFDLKGMAHSRSPAIIETFNGLETPILDGHWKIPHWTFGETVTGSSGASLLNQNLQVIGGLSGSTTRGDEVSDYFFRFDKVWDYLADNQLNSHLDPLLTNTRSLKTISFKGLRDLSKISNYNYSDSLAESVFLEDDEVVSQKLNDVIKGEIAGVYLTIEQIGADLLNTMTISVLSTDGLVHIEEVSLFKLNENQENFIPFLTNIPFVGELTIEIKLNGTIEGEFVRFVSVKKEGSSDLVISILSKSAEIKSEIPSQEEAILPFPNPSNGFVFVNQVIVECTLYDLKGFNANIPFELNAFGQTVIDLTNVASGTYYLRLLTENMVPSIEKVIIK